MKIETFFISVGVLLSFVLIGATFIHGGRVIADEASYYPTVIDPYASRDDGLRGAVFAGGCFWCTEAVFDTVDGVKETISGYTGGHVENPSYQQIGQGDTGHFEALYVLYDPKVVEYATLLKNYWWSVDPTDDGGQFADRGAHYTTAIFVASAEEKQLAERSMMAQEAEIGQKIVTQILEAKPFYPAESYHQDYHMKNPMRYRAYKYGSGRVDRLRDLWGKDAK